MLTVTLSSYLTLGALLFAISIAGIFLNRKNVVILLMCIELMLLAANINFVAFSHYLNDSAGQIFVFFILTVAAAEADAGEAEGDLKEIMQEANQAKVIKTALRPAKNL